MPADDPVVVEVVLGLGTLEQLAHSDVAESSGLAREAPASSVHPAECLKGGATTLGDDGCGDKAALLVHRFAAEEQHAEGREEDRHGRRWDRHGRAERTSHSTHRRRGAPRHQTTTELHVAAMAGDLDKLNNLLDQGYDPDSMDFNAKTALHVAAIKDQPEAARTLVRRGACISAEDRDGASPLHWGAAYGRLETMRVLIQNGAKVDFQDRFDAAQLLLEYEADVDARDFNEASVLHAAAVKGDTPLIELLFAYRANPEIEDMNGKTPLIWASIREQIDALNALVKHGATVDAVDLDGKTALHHAAARGRMKSIETLVSHGASIEVTDCEGISPLHLAAKSGQTAAMELLLSFRATINPKDKKTFLRGWRSRRLLLQAAQGGSTGVLELLLRSGVPVSSKDTRGVTALHLAARAGQTDAVDFLATQGPRLQKKKRLWKRVLLALMRVARRKRRAVNARDKDGSTPLHWAVLGGQVEAARMLLESGAKVNKRDRGGATPLKLAVASGNKAMMKLLLHYGGRVHVEPRRNRMLVSLKSLPTAAKSLPSTVSRKRRDHFELLPQAA
eukprot:jgi/Chlat1/1545/Chrsp122S08665